MSFSVLVILEQSCSGVRDRFIHYHTNSESFMNREWIGGSQRSLLKALKLASQRVPCFKCCRCVDYSRSFSVFIKHLRAQCKKSLQCFKFSWFGT